MQAGCLQINEETERQKKMNLVALLSGIGLCAGAFYLFRTAGQAYVNRRQAANLKMTPIGQLRPGLVFTGGEVVCDDPLQTPYTRTAAAWYRYVATQQYHRRNQSGFYDETLASGNRSCPFSLKDRTGEVTIVGAGGTMVGYPHYRILKSQSGKKTALKERIKKLKDMDHEKYPEGSKKPFFRKIEAEPSPLDVPDDLVELAPDSAEVKTALRKYYEHWVQPGDHIYILGTAVHDADTPGMKIIKGGKHIPFFLSNDVADLGSGAFQKNMRVSLLVGIGMSILGVFLLLIGVGVINA